MEHLFTYGTLQDEQVQQYLFGRTLPGYQDSLLGFKRLENAVYQRYPLVVKTENTKDEVHGMAYEVSFSDLKKADIYETTAYKREKITLKSGKKAWVYLENSK